MWFTIAYWSQATESDQIEIVTRQAFANIVSLSRESMKQVIYTPGIKTFASQN